MTESELRLELRGLVEKWGETVQEVRALADRFANVRDSVLEIGRWENSSFGLRSEASTLENCAANLTAILDKHADTSAAESCIVDDGEEPND